MNDNEIKGLNVDELRRFTLHTNCIAKHTSICTATYNATHTATHTAIHTATRTATCTAAHSTKQTTTH